MDPRASQEHIKKAFRALALRHHPDQNKHSAASENLFKEINEAYKVLSDRAARAKFHDYYIEHFEGTETDVNTKSTSPSTPVRPPIKPTTKSGKTSIKKTPAPAKVGKNLIYHLNITFEDALKGTDKKISYMRMIRGERQTANTTVSVPQGVRDGQKLRIRGAGESLTGQQTPGDLVVEVHYLPHPYFTLDGDDLIVSIPLSPIDILLQEPIIIPTPTGPVELNKLNWEEIKNPTLRLKDRGFPRSENPKGRGDLFVRFMIEVPSSIDENLKEQLRKIKRALPMTEAQIEFDRLSR